VSPGEIAIFETTGALGAPVFRGLAHRDESRSPPRGEAFRRHGVSTQADASRLATA